MPELAELADQIVETWAIHNRIHIYVLNTLPSEALADASAPRARTVADIFAHVHNVRLMWLKAAAPDLLNGLVKLEKDGANGAETLKNALTASGHAVESLLRHALENGGRVKNFKPHAAAFLGYLIAHESHHRGQVTMVLKQNGHALDAKTDFGMWEWGTR